MKSKAVVCLLVVLLGQSAFAASANYGVLYPESHGPYQTVFKSIISGVETELKSSIEKIAVDDDGNLTKVNQWIDRHKIGVLISLGQQGLELCGGLNQGVQLIAGAVLSPPGDACRVRGGIALAPHPEVLFKRLLSLKAGVKRVHVVYNEGFNGWLIEYARDAARHNGLDLVTHQAESLDQAAKLYNHIIIDLSSSTDAIWLPQDPYTVDQKTVLPVLLKEAWNREFVVFSSNAAHVKRGVLFGLYPDFEAMGSSLGRIAMQSTQSNTVKKPTVQPLTDVLIAVNLRTADHLKLNLKSGQRETFDLTFPASR